MTPPLFPLSGMLPDDIDAQIIDARVVRERLHALVARLQRDRTAWQHGVTALPRRTRLTFEQRQRYEQHLRDAAGRRRPRAW
ncbi:MAG: hypothetical protein ACRD1V_08485 [Vicinamibacterales bacterium]